MQTLRVQPRLASGDLRSETQSRQTKLSFLQLWDDGHEAAVFRSNRFSALALMVNCSASQTKIQPEHCCDLLAKTSELLQQKGTPSTPQQRKKVPQPTDQQWNCVHLCCSQLDDSVPVSMMRAEAGEEPAQASCGSSSEGSGFSCHTSTKSVTPLSKPVMPSTRTLRQVSFATSSQSARTF